MDKVGTKKLLVCHSLREVDALVAEYWFGWQWWHEPATNQYRILSPTFDPASGLTQWEQCDCPFNLADLDDWWMRLPTYTSWLRMEDVVNKIESMGYRWDVGGAPGGAGAWAMVMPVDAEMFDDSPEYHGDAATAPVALCLAVLASVGVQVDLRIESVAANSVSVERIEVP